MTKQYCITEHNDHEGEDFSYVMDLTPDQFEHIKNVIEDNELDEEQLEIEESNYTIGDMKLINDHSKNSYKKRIAFCTFNNPSGLFEYNDDELYYSVFYKGSGLTEIERW